MADFAVIENNFVVNIIAADDLETANFVTNKTCVEVTENTKQAHIGGEYRDGVFLPKKPADNYFWSEASFAWIEDGYVWNEKDLIWEKQ